MFRDKTAPLAVLGCCLAVFWPGALTFGFPGAMASVWQEMFQVGHGATGLIIFFMLAAVGAFMFLVGRWQERYGTRKMIILGVFLTACGSALVANASSIHMVYAWAFLNGLASCFVYIPALTLVQRWYPAKKGLAAGIVSMVFGLSAAIGSPLFAGMLVTLGYIFMNYGIAFLTLLVGLAGCYLAHDPLEETEAAAVFGLSSNIEHSGTGGQARSLTVQESLQTPSFWYLWITWILAGAAGISMTVLSTAYGLSLGFPLHSAILILVAFNLTNGTGRLISGILSDRFGRNRVMSLSFLAAGLAYFIFPWTEGLAGSALLAAVVGFSFGTLFSVSAPLVADCFGMEHFGAIFGLTFAAYGFVAGPMGPALTGLVLDMTQDNFYPVFLYLGVLCLLAGIFIRQVVPIPPESELT